MIPSPAKPTRSRRGASVPAAAGGLDPEPVTGSQATDGLAGQRCAVEQIASGRAIRATGSTARTVAASLADQGESHRLQRLDLAHDTVAAAVRTGAAGAAPQLVAHDAQRIGALERFDRGVERVAHRDVDAARPVGVRARALAAAERLVVGKALLAHPQAVHPSLPD